MRTGHAALAETILLFSHGIAMSNRPEDRVLAERYLAALAPMLAAAVVGKNVLADLREMERLFGQTWIVDVGPFEAAFAKWKEFRDTYEAEALAGMSVHERLEALELSDAYRRASQAGNVAEVRRLLLSARVDEASIDAAVNALGAQ